MKKDVSFFEVYGKVNYTINDNWQVGVNEYYSPNFLNSGAWGDYASITAQSIPRRARPSAPAASACMSPANSDGSGSEPPIRFTGRPSPIQALPGRSRMASPTPATTPGISASASPTRCSRSTCATPTPTCRRATATPSPAPSTPAEPTNVTAINPGGAGSNWCGAAGIVKLSADLTAMTNLK